MLISIVASGGQIESSDVLESNLTVQGIECVGGVNQEYCLGVAGVKGGSHGVHALNKRSMTVNLMDPGGREIFDRLVAVIEVLIKNPTETLEKLGIFYYSLKAVKDDIIMLRLPAYGSTGPYRHYRALGVRIEGVVGNTMLWGYEDTDQSYNTTVLMSDAAAGAQGAFSVPAALRHGKRTGEGQLVELGQAEKSTIWNTA